MGLLTVKKPGAVAPPQPDRNGNNGGFEIRPLAGVKGAVSENLLAAIKKIVHDEVRLAFEEAHQKSWIQKMKRRLFT